MLDGVGDERTGGDDDQRAEEQEEVEGGHNRVVAAGALVAGGGSAAVSGFPRRVLWIHSGSITGRVPAFCGSAVGQHSQVLVGSMFARKSLGPGRDRHDAVELVGPMPYEIAIIKLVAVEVASMLPSQRDD